jgi:integrase
MISVGLVCPECGSKRIYKDGFRYLGNGQPKQRYICRERNCGYRFSKRTEKSYKQSRIKGNRQICVLKAKNLAAQEIEKICAGDGNLLNYAWLLKKKRGLADNTISLRVNTLRIIQKKGVNLRDPDSFETVLATEPLTKARKWQWVACYKSYTKIMKISWDPIRVKYEPRQPFLPTHDEMKALISAARKRLATFLQTALTTGARVGELSKLKWKDVDSEKNTISINSAEKGSRNRTIKVPSKTIAMINALLKRNDIYVFDTKPVNVRVSFQNLRKRLAHSQNNPRFLQIHLHTFRHFYATETLRQTKNLCYVKYNLGHKSIVNTERYIHLVDFCSDKYYSAVATTLKEVRQLAEDGWNYFQEIEGKKVFRKPK